MKRPFLLFLPFLLFIAGAFVACEEVEEAGKYDNWVPRNEAFIDSIKGKTGDNIVASLEDAEKMEIGTLYAISVPTSGTGVDGTLRPQYVYCKKLWKTDSGAYPLFTEKVSVFYRGTFITGESSMAILTVLERQTAKFRCLYQIPCPKTLPNPNGLRRLILLPNLWYPKLLQAGHGLCNICGSVSVGCCIFPGRADMVQAAVHPVIFPVIRH